MTAFNSGLVELDAHTVLRKVSKLIEEKEQEWAEEDARKGNIEFGIKFGKRREGVRYASAHTPLPNELGGKFGIMTLE